MIRTQQYQNGIIHLPVYDDSDVITNGQGLIWGKDEDATSYCSMIDLADRALPVETFAVACESLTETSSNISTPLIYQVQCQMVENVPIWKIYQDMSTSTDLSVTSSTTTQLTHATDDDPLEGSWIYINSGTGVGQLRYCKESAATTKDPNTAFTTAPINTSDYILIRNVGLPKGGQDLNTTLDKLVSVLTATGEIMILKNFIQSQATGIQEMDITKNSWLEQDDYNTRGGVRFFSHIIFMDRALSDPVVACA